MTYREDLPENCPPQEAKPIAEPRKFFRLISDYPPVERDFDSVWKLQPERRRNLDPCQARGLSVFDTPVEAQRRTSYRNLRDKVVCEVNITPQSGPLLMTSSHHYTWWPLSYYDILAQCSEYKT